MTELKSICLIACTSSKGSYPAKAEYLYQSPLFRGTRNYAETRCETWLILSAKYGLVRPEDILDPYDESLYSMSDLQRKTWAEAAYAKLKALMGVETKVVFLAGDKYRRYLEEFATQEGRSTAAPLSFLGIGSQVAWLRKIEREQSRLRDIDRLYALLHRAQNANGGEFTCLRKLDSGVVRPNRGVYFFFQDGENRMTSPFCPRIVRVGTHAVSCGSSSSLWNRLRTHRGGRDGLGNHRGSIFRLHVGESLIRKSGLEATFPTWGHGQSASESVRMSEQEIELEVSDIIGNLEVVWLDVPDEPSADSDRGYIERNVIALLSGPTGPLDLAYPTWLGKWSSREAVATSGLWNVNHIYERYDPNALDVIEKYVEIVERNAPRPSKSFAPENWRQKAKNNVGKTEQLTLI